MSDISAGSGTSAFWRAAEVPATEAKAVAVTVADYWQERLVPLPRETPLPVDFPYPARPADARFAGFLTRGTALTLHTDAVTQLAAYVALLHRYASGSDDITVGHDGLPLRITVDPAASFAELRAQVAAAVESAAARRVPLDALAARLRPEPTRGGGCSSIRRSAR